MSEKDEYIHKITTTLGIYNFFENTGENINKLTFIHNNIYKLMLDEKISTLIAIDEEMANLMIDYAKERSPGQNIDTGELALQKWHDTVWHKTIKKQTDKLRELRKELN